jgi:GNAT superfamily N-acetyltransferase
MVDIQIRQARLDDTSAISQLYQAHIQRWQRLNPDGQVDDVPYEALTIYERWLHGGAWMSIETGAIHLSHLLRGAGIPLVAQVAGRVMAYTELYLGSEPEPFGRNLSLNHPTVHPDCGDMGLETALLTHAREQTKSEKCQRLLVNVAVPERKTFYSQQGLSERAVVRRFNLPARTGQGFYRTTDHDDPSPEQIDGWHMPVGRIASARQQWETLWPGTLDAIPEIRQRHIHRLEFNASGQEAYIYCQQQMYLERNADISCWSPRPLTSQLLTAIRDWAHKEGYRTLVMTVMDETAKVLGPEAEPDGYSQSVYGVDV